jgi:DNA invertase Pin-like site-specific DNA recombinase
MEVLRVGGYYRQSVKEDQGIENQKKAVAEEASRRGWLMAEHYEDNATSATKARGPGTAWARMLSDHANGAIDLVMVTRTARLLRRNRDAVTLSERKIRVVTLDGMDSGTPGGRFFLNNMVNAAEYEIEEKEDRAGPYRAARRQQGHPWPGKPPFGYSWVPALKRDALGTRYAVVPEEAAVVRQMSADLLAGVSLRQIVADLRVRGVRTKAGAQWGVSSARRLLLSPFPAAMLPERQEAGSGYDAAKIDPTRCVPGQWEPILSVSEWLAARGQLLRPERRSNPEGTARRHLLSGLAVCGARGCKTPVISARVRTSAGQQNGYRCKAGHFHRLGSPIDAFVERIAIERLAQPDAVDLLAPPPSGPSIAELRAEELAHSEAKARILAAVVAGAIDTADAVEDRQRIDEKLISVQRRRAEAEQINPLACVVGSADVRSAWQALSLGRKRQVLQALFGGLEICPVGPGARTDTHEKVAASLRVAWRVDHAVTEEDWSELPTSPMSNGEHVPDLSPQQR